MPAVTHDTREERFNALYAEFRHMVRRRVEFVLKDNYELYDDTEQDTWLKAWHGMKPEKEVGPAWLSTIATHAAYDALRKKYHVGSPGRGGKREQRPLPESLDAEAGAYELIEAERSDIDRFHLHEEIHDMLSLMNHPDESAACFFFADGMTYLEIMRRFHLSKRMVWAIIRRMRERSRKARAEALV